MSEFRSTQKKEGAQLSLAFSGTIDEDVSFPALDMAGVSKVVIDLKDVKTINSVGIREWLNWIRPVAEKSEIVLQRCPKALVFQFNMVDGFLPQRSKVESFYVPFFCEKCDKEETVLFNTDKDVVTTDGTPKIKFDRNASGICKQADCELEMDVTEGKYFQFLKRK